MSLNPQGCCKERSFRSHIKSVMAAVQEREDKSITKIIMGYKKKNRKQKVLRNVITIIGLKTL